MDKIEFVELTQKQVEDWVNDLPDPDKVKLPTYQGAIVKNAVKYGWFKSPALKVEDVDALSRVDVRGLSEAVVKKYQEVETTKDLPQ